MTTETQPKVSLSTQVRLLRALRDQLAGARQAVEEIEAQARQDHRDAYHQQLHWTEMVTAQDAAVRKQAIQEFQETGDKAPGPGIGIRVRERLEYSMGLAKDWCMAHGGLALEVNKRDLERLAKAAPSQFPFVTFSEELQATIAPDLGKALGPEAEGPF